MLIGLGIRDLVLIETLDVAFGPGLTALTGETGAGKSIILDALGLASRLSHQPAQLSGGEQQRVAVARALTNRPRLLLADEPTGNLDPATSELVYQSLNALVRATGVAAVIATHNLESIRHMDRVLSLKDGRLVEHRAVARLPSESLEDWEIRLVARRLALSGDGE